MGKKAALIIVDMQNDFLPGGALGIEGGSDIIPVLNRSIRDFGEAGLPIFLSRDWHPPVTKHFREYGGVWPPHCIQGTRGAEFHPELVIPPQAVIVSKGMDPERDDYSAFHARTEDGKLLPQALRESSVDEIVIGGLATDYCVRQTALEALRQGFGVTILADGCRGVDLQPGDSDRALREVETAGAVLKRI
jgi:nicotinamidase/pyrazinamidase